MTEKCHKCKNNGTKSVTKHQSDGIHFWMKVLRSWSQKKKWEFFLFFSPKNCWSWPGSGRATEQQKQQEKLMMIITLHSEKVMIKPSIRIHYELNKFTLWNGLVFKWDKTQDLTRGRWRKTRLFRPTKYSFAEKMFYGWTGLRTLSFLFSTHHPPFTLPHQFNSRS